MSALFAFNLSLVVVLVSNLFKGDLFELDKTVEDNFALNLANSELDIPFAIACCSTWSMVSPACFNCCWSCAISASVRASTLKVDKSLEDNKLELCAFAENTNRLKIKLISVSLKNFILF